MNSPAHRYAQSQNETASPERLMVLLFQAALRNIRNGAALLTSGKYTEGARALLQASDIVLELRSTLCRPRAPELCDKLGSIYHFVCARLNRAALSRNVQAAREAERVFAPIAEAFEMAVASLQQGAARR